jgi:hypothetical protein
MITGVQSSCASLALRIGRRASHGVLGHVPPSTVDGVHFLVVDGDSANKPFSIAAIQPVLVLEAGILRRFLSRFGCGSISHLKTSPMFRMRLQMRSISDLAGKGSREVMRPSRGWHM